MTDKNTAALAADHTEHHLEMAGRWYMVNKDGMATLCADREDAEKEAADAQSVWPHMGPHRAVRLIEASFEAADMATAAAQGFRDGVASVAASAGEPVAHLWQHCETGRTRIVMPDMIVDADASWQVVGPLYLGAAPPTAQAEGWRPIETAPKDGSYLLLWEQYSDAPFVGYWSSGWDGANVVDVLSMPITHWMPIPAPPTAAEGVGHG